MKLEALLHRFDVDDSILPIKLAAYAEHETRGNELLEILGDRERWNGASDRRQDVAIEVVRRRLGEDYRLDRVGVWECDNVQRLRSTKDDVILQGSSSYQAHTSGYILGPVPISHRLATFVHKATGIELQLIPGVSGQSARHMYTMVELELSIQHDGSQRAIEQWIEHDFRQRYGMAPDMTKAFVNEWESMEVSGHISPIAPFLVGRWPVTEGQRLKALGYKVKDVPSSHMPLVGYSHRDAVLDLGGQGMRLPTPAETSWAMKGGATTRFPWGDDFEPRGGDYVWHADNSGDYWPGADWQEHVETRPAPRPHPVTEHEKAGAWNAWGLVDMIGNVWEWLDYGHVIGTSFLSSQPQNPDFLSPHQTTPGIRDRHIGFRPFKSIPGLP